MPPQQILSTDSVTLTVDAVIYYRVFDPIRAACKLQDYNVVSGKDNCHPLPSPSCQHISINRNLGKAVSAPLLFMHSIASRVQVLRLIYLSYCAARIITTYPYDT